MVRKVESNGFRRSKSEIFLGKEEEAEEEAEPPGRRSYTSEERGMAE